MDDVIRIPNPDDHKVTFNVVAFIPHPDYEKQVMAELSGVQFVIDVTRAKPVASAQPQGE
jgi:hypothetical protein